MMKFLLTTAIALMFSLSLFGQNKKKYTIVFEEYDQVEIKQVIGVISPLFKAPVNSDGNNFLKLFFISEENVTENKLKTVLEENEFTYKDFKIENYED